VTEIRDERAGEEWLDRALSRYAGSQPRPGLEGRVLAHVRAERERRRPRQRWWSIVGSIAVAAAVAVAMWLGLREQRSPTRGIAQVPPAEANQETTSLPARQFAGEKGHGSKESGARQRRGAGLRKRPPKLDQFPSPLPLNEQEKLLSIYIREFPENAVLVARAQTELRKREELEMVEPPPDGTNPGTDRIE